MEYYDITGRIDSQSYDRSLVIEGCFRRNANAIDGIMKVTPSLSNDIRNSIRGAMSQIDGQHVLAFYHFCCNRPSSVFFRLCAQQDTGIYRGYRINNVCCVTYQEMENMYAVSADIPNPQHYDTVQLHVVKRPFIDQQIRNVLK